MTNPVAQKSNPSEEVLDSEDKLVLEEELLEDVLYLLELLEDSLDREVLLEELLCEVELLLEL